MAAIEAGAGVVRRRNHDGIEIQIRFQHFSVIPERCGVLVLIGRILQVTVIHITQGDHVLMPHGSKVVMSAADPDDAQAQRSLRIRGRSP